ncbi:MAG: hypothetical protein ABI480_13610 [Chitinophagaceae bacterium]
MIIKPGAPPEKRGALFYARKWIPTIDHVKTFELLSFSAAKKESNKEKATDTGNIRKDDSYW